ncbi:MAG: hypothetical protein SGPRY_005785 [Prymnesium sp.]
MAISKSSDSDSLHQYSCPVTESDALHHCRSSAMHFTQAARVGSALRSDGTRAVAAHTPSKSSTADERRGQAGRPEEHMSSSPSKVEGFGGLPFLSVFCRFIWFPRARFRSESYAGCARPIWCSARVGMRYLSRCSRVDNIRQWLAVPFTSGLHRM